MSSAPHVATLRMPAEWAPHERTLMSWPCRVELWGEQYEAAKEAHAAVANAIAAFEPVTMAANPLQIAEARAALDAGVDVLAMELDDSWLRDNGPIFVLDDDGRRIGVHFRFNAWGEKFRPWDADEEAGRKLVEWLGDPVVEAPIVLEGGSIAVDGAGTLITTEQCLLHPRRNPELTKDQIEEQLKAHLGVERVVWLGQGLVEDRDTDGHVDLIAAFTEPGKVLLQMVGEDNPNRANCVENERRLREAGIEVRTLDHLPYDSLAGEDLALAYMNFYVCNGAVIVPVAGQETDEPALETIRAAFPGREVVGVPGRILAFGGGGPHCITQQVPAAGA